MAKGAQTTTRICWKGGADPRLLIGRRLPPCLGGLFGDLGALFLAQRLGASLAATLAEADGGSILAGAVINF
jgi:hypothetical protein